MYGVVICPLPITTKTKGRTSPPESMTKREEERETNNNKKRKKRKKEENSLRKKDVKIVSIGSPWREITVVRYSTIVH